MDTITKEKEPTIKTKVKDRIKVVEAYLKQLSIADKQFDILLYSIERLDPDLMLDHTNPLITKLNLIDDCEDAQLFVRSFTKQKYIQTLLNNDSLSTYSLFHHSFNEVIIFIYNLRHVYGKINKEDPKDHIWNSENKLVNEIIIVIHSILSTYIKWYFYKISKQESITDYLTHFETGKGPLLIVGD